MEVIVISTCDTFAYDGVQTEMIVEVVRIPEGKSDLETFGFWVGTSGLEEDAALNYSFVTYVVKELPPTA